MAIKKNEIYSSLDASCDKLRGGMDPSQYKNYILSLLFMKYVTMKFKGKPYPQVTVPEGGSFDDLKALGGEIAKVKEAEAEVNVMVTACNAITRRADLFTQVLIKLEALMFPQLYSFESIIDMEGCDFAKYRPESKKRVAALLSTAQAVKAILDTALLDDKGALTSKSEDVLLETNKYLKRAAA